MNPLVEIFTEVSPEFKVAKEVIEAVDSKGEIRRQLVREVKGQLGLKQVRRGQPRPVRKVKRCAGLKRAAPQAKQWRRSGEQALTQQSLDRGRR